MVQHDEQKLHPGRTVALTLGWVAAGLGVAAAAASFAASAVAVTMARRIVTPPLDREEDVRILASSETTITLSVTKDSFTPGQYSFWFNRETGHARVGEILDYDDVSVTRTLQAVDFGDLSSARRGRLSGWYFLRPRELGYPYDNVEITSELGINPAWLIPAEQDTGRWVIQVHGRAVRRSETLRAVTVFRDAGYHSLLVSYRNDGDAPATPDNRYALGAAEWLDVDAAIEYAIANGATDIVLMGWSMGGATVLQAATRSAHSDIIRGIVLESPVIDWVSVLDYQGASAHVPRGIRLAALALIGEKRGRFLTGLGQPIDLSKLDFVTRAADLRWPILLLHSDDDGYVPSAPSRALALARPDIVTFVPFDTARHVKLWNYDAARWTDSITEWLELRAQPTESQSAAANKKISG